MSEEQDIIRKITYSPKPKKSTELFKAIVKIKKEVDYLYQEIKELTKKDYNL